MNSLPRIITHWANLPRNENDGTVHVLLANRLSPQKGYEFLIDGFPAAMAYFRQSNFRVQFNVLANGDIKRQDRLFVLSQLYPELNVFPYSSEYNQSCALAATDLALQPSVFEPGGLFAMTAQYHDVLAMGTSVGGLKDILGANEHPADSFHTLQSAGVQFGDYGLLHQASPSQPLTSERFWSGLQEIIRLQHLQPTFFNRVKRDGRDRAHDHYAPTRMATDYFSQVYEPLLRT
jgi:glycogen synthase